ncbi:uncharacterized protein LOC123586606 [Leopardus geoffroyi]|uniref:uncharacterized protein LOC123586606 n=1 Tax=Leopardus geoffroyi TaxID=46844 RepID=UPI001E263B3A|nr:uncharacterized protein LOC123586606 [Leopardus geoffroyi]
MFRTLRELPRVSSELMPTKTIRSVQIHTVPIPSKEPGPFAASPPAAVEASRTSTFRPVVSRGRTGVFTPNFAGPHGCPSFAEKTVEPQREKVVFQDHTGKKRENTTLSLVQPFSITLATGLVTTSSASFSLECVLASFLPIPSQACPSSQLRLGTLAFLSYYRTEQLRLVCSQARRKVQEWKRRLEKASGRSQRSWSRSGVWMEEMEWKRLALPEGLQRAEGIDPAGGRCRAAPSHSGRKTALIPESHLSSLFERKACFHANGQGEAMMSRLQLWGGSSLKPYGMSTLAWNKRIEGVAKMSQE